MKKYIFIFFILIISFCFLHGLCFASDVNGVNDINGVNDVNNKTISANTDNIRKPLFAGTFYPDNKKDIKQLIKHFRTNFCKYRKNYFGKKLKALIMPHAGYVYSGIAAAYATFLLDNEKFEKVIILGPDHTTGFAKSLVNCADKWQTPLGFIDIDKNALKLVKKHSFFNYESQNYLKEHSIEVVLPFLQFSLKDFKLIPIITGRANPDKIAKALDDLIDKNTLLVASSDLSHYLSYAKAIIKDHNTISNILNYKDHEILMDNNNACGKIPIAALLKIAQKRKWQPYLLNYYNSGDVTKNRERVVGYCSIAFFESDLKSEKKGLIKNMNNVFTANQGQTLLKLARITIAKELGAEINKKEIELLEKKLDTKDFKQKSGTFVTLYKNNNLRGCIGSILPVESAKKSIKNNAINAGFNDPRFSSLTLDELNNINIEISILSKPENLEYIDGKDLLSKIRPNIDGLIIKKGVNSATFLPQVWEQLPLPQDFLSHLCLKANLNKNEWENGKLEVMTYQVQSFKENH